MTLRVETLGLDDITAGNAEAPLPAIFSRCSCVSRPGRAARGREQKDGAFGHHTIHIEQHQLDLFCALVSHAAILAAVATLTSRRAGRPGENSPPFAARFYLAFQPSLARADGLVARN